MTEIEVGTPDTTNEPPLLEVEGLSKIFGSVRALSDVSISVAAGETLALVGDNGAGKSTLVKMLSGVEVPDKGVIRIENKPIRLHGPHDARKHGIQTVFQDLSLCDNLSVTANMFLGRESVRGRLLCERDMEDEARRTFDRLRVQTIVAIGRAVMSHAKVVILDEPTAALGVEQTAMVLRLVRTLSDQGQAVILVSHSLAEVFEVADRIIVLRLGLKVAEFRTNQTTTDEVISSITGALHHIEKMEAKP
jgi:D-xylose transport system ATP-binding protein